MEIEKIIKTLQNVKRMREQGTGVVNEQDRDELEEKGLVENYSLTSEGEAWLKMNGGKFPYIGDRRQSWHKL